jgi:outer membrane lipoprotein-sorting protein
VKIVGSKIRFLFLAVLLAQAGCNLASRKVQIPPDQRLLPAKSATKEELFRNLEEKSREIQTFRANMTLDVSGGGSQSGVLTEYRQTSGVLLVERPHKIRIRVYAPVVLSTIADMVSDGRQYRLSIPIKNQWSEGDVNVRINSKNPIANLRPQHFLDGLFVDITPYLNNPQVKYSFNLQTENRHSYYVFTFMNVSGQGPEVETLEKLWIDRSENLEVTRKQIFGSDGNIETDVEYSNYQKEGNVRFPQMVVIQRPVEDYTLKLTFQKTTINEKLPDSTFNLERPEGSELVQIAQ